MRNLKRVLSLTLATAMLFGMMVMGASAADKTASDLNDMGKVTNKEAVTLLVDLGIIEGKSDGSYAPAETVNRATMAKLITIMMMGNVDQNSFKGTATDLKDIDGHWAEGYIKFCYSNKIISGDGAGSFFPDQEVTTVQAAKMLLVAMGYDAKDRKYENDSNWSVNIMKDAQSTKDSATSVRSLTAGLSIKATDPLSRDNAAQMIFNTLFVQTVEAQYQWDNGIQYIQKYDPKSSMAVLTYNGLYSVSGTLDSVDASGFGAAATLKKADGTAGGSLTAGDKIKATTGDIGSPIVLYKDTKGFVSTAAVSATATTLATSHNGTAWNKLTVKGQKGYMGYEADDSVAIYVNGDKKQDVAYASISAAHSNLAANIGTTVEFFDNDKDNKYDVVKFTTYTLSQVSKVTAAKADGTEATITLKGVNGGAAIKESLVVGDFTALTKDTYVMVAKIGSQFYTYEPTTVTGKMTKYNTSTKTMTIDGSSYTASALPNGVGFTQAQGFTGTGESVFYIDQNSYVVAVDGVAVETKYAIVDAIAFVPGSGTETKGYAEARLVFADGTKATVKVNKMGTNDVTQSDSSAGIPLDGLAAGDYDTGTVGNTTALNDADYTNCIFTYTTNSDSVYALTRVAEDATGQVTKGAPVVGTQIANDNTVYVYKVTNGTASTFTTYTGYKNAPSTKDGTNVLTVATKNGYASLVYVSGTGAQITGDAGSVIMFLDANYTVDNSDPNAPLYEYSAIIDGELDTYASKNILTNVTVGTLYNVIVDSKGNISSPASNGVDFSDSAAATTSTYYPTVAAADAANGTVKTVDEFGSTSDKVLSYNGDETVYLVNLADKTVNTGSMTDVTAGTYFLAKAAGATGAQASTASIVYVLVGAGDATVGASALAMTGTATSSGNLLAVGGSTAAIASAAADQTLIVTPTLVSGRHVVVSIAGAGTTVTGAIDGAATYTLVAGDIGANLTVSLTSYESGKTPITTTYTITVA